MPVSISEITEQTILVDGRIRVKFKYTFEDGRFFNVGYVHAKDESQVNELLATKANQLNESVKQSDAQDAISQNIQTAYKDASQEDVYFAYLFDGYNNDDVLESYNVMSKVAPQILSLGLTVEQMAAVFNQTVEMAQAVFDKWDYLNTNKATIIAYGEL